MELQRKKCRCAAIPFKYEDGSEKVICSGEMTYTITLKVCGYCDAAKELMKEKNIPFVEISLDHDQDARKMLKGMNCKTVPQIFAEEQIWVVIPTYELF